MNRPESEIRNGIVIIRANLSDIPGGIGMGLVDESFYAHLGKGYKHFIIDLSGANWVNSSDIATLIHMLKVVQRSPDPSAKLVLCGIGQRIKSILVIARLASVFETYDTVEEALKVLTPPTPAPSPK